MRTVLDAFIDDASKVVQDIESWTLATPLNMRLDVPKSLHPSPPFNPSQRRTIRMWKDENVDFPDGDIILRALGPPSRDFRVHKLVLSLASPVFKDMFSLPQPTSEDPASSAAGVEIIEVTDPPDALDIILRMIYPLTPPSPDGGLGTLVECLVIADKYDIKGAKTRLHHVLARHNATQPLRVYAIASRFGFASLADSASNHILTAVHLPGIPELPADFEFVPATVYHKLVRHHASYLEAVVEIVKQTPLKSKCRNCSGWRSSAEEVFRLRFAHLVVTGAPVEVQHCYSAWVKAYGSNPDCEENCALKFIRSVVSGVDKGLGKPYVSSLQKKAL